MLHFFNTNYGRFSKYHPVCCIVKISFFLLLSTTETQKFGLFECHPVSSSNRNIFHITGPLRGESTCHQWIPITEMWNFDVFFDLPLNKQMSKQSRCWCFEMPSCSLWHHCNTKSPNRHTYLTLENDIRRVFCDFKASSMGYILWFV